MSADARARAVETLGLPAGATAPEAINAFLTALPATGFVPPADMVAATNLLAEVKLAGDHYVDSSVGILAEVEEFAQAFWSLSPLEREDRWTTLANRSDERVTDRLQSLKAGLQVGISPQSNPTDEELAGLLRELFILPLRARSIRRNEWLLANAARVVALSRAADDLSRSSPETTALDPILFDRLSPSFSVSEFAAGATTTPLAEPPTSDPTRPPRHHSLGVNGAASAHSSGQKSNSGGLSWILYLGGVLLLALIRALSSNSPSTGTTYNSGSSPTFRQALQNTRNPSDIELTFTTEQVADFKKFNAGIGGRSPVQYAAWLYAGKPEAGKAVRVPLFVLSVSTGGTRTVYFTESDIAKFERFEKDGNGPRPTRYDELVWVGRPRKAGTAALPPDASDRPSPAP